MRVLTWNVWWRFGPWEQRKGVILDVLRELRPDVVGLQEVWAVPGGEHLAEWLAKELGMYHAWAPSPCPEPWRRRLPADAVERAVDVGNAVLSRWPVLEQEVRRLPAPTGPGAEDDGRLALHTLLDAPGQPVPFFTTHLTAAVTASAVRCQQVAALVEFIAERRGGSAFPPVLTGDFNAWPDSDEIRLLGGYKTAPAVPGTVLLDAWEYAEPGAPSATWEPENPYVGPKHEPPVRIDYVHVGPPGPGGLGHVRSVRRAGRGPAGPDRVWGSDHAAVLVELWP